MGLAGRKVKQRIPNDPRNLAWSDDAARFGQAYLSKLGWDPSQGLGASGDGIKSHLKVSQKLDMLGIGAAHARDPHGIAWKQNKDFEALLRRLNESNATTPAHNSDGEGDSDGSAKAVAAESKGDDASVTKVTTNEVGGKGKKEKKSKKRSSKEASLDEGEKEEKEARKRRKEEKRKSKELKKQKKSKSSSPDDLPVPESGKIVTTATTTAATSAIVPPVSHVKGRPMAHRARLQASKRLANKSAAAISEILGIAPIPSAPTSTSLPTSVAATTPGTPSAHEYQNTTPAEIPESLENLTTSSTSVADYFKAKLAARSGGTSTIALSPLADPFASYDEEHDAPPRRGLGSQRIAEDNEEDAPRRAGLGAASSSMPLDDAAPRTGIGMKSSAFAQFFTTSVSSHATVLEMASSSIIAARASSPTVSLAPVTPLVESKSSKKEKKEKRAKKEKEDKEKEGTKENQKTTKNLPTPADEGKSAKGEDKPPKKEKSKKDKSKGQEPVATVAYDDEDDASGTASKAEKHKPKKPADAVDVVAQPSPSVAVGDGDEVKREKKKRKKEWFPKEVDDDKESEAAGEKPSKKKRSRSDS